MKLTIDKSAFTPEQAESAAEYLLHLKQDKFFDAEELERMAAFFSDNAFDRKVLAIKGTVTRNGNPLMEDGEIDCRIEAFIESLDACYRIVFFFNDYLMLCGDNHDEVKSKAYIRKYVAVD